ncbi:hypothetical protein WJX81_007279 [Elliptochloris bilobata]|uniref:Uncharacterized protein n=1 Tax=Elliptochloris bilobata TaxID=381761 RepID=A0AAW1RUM5_9CHLO
MAAACVGPLYVSSAELFISGSGHADFLGREVKLAGRDAPLYALTTNQDAFKKWELERRAPLPMAPRPVPLVLAQRSPVRFSAQTSYAAEFPAHTIAPRPAPPPFQQRAGGARFDAVTSYTDEFHAHEVEARPPAPQPMPRPKPRPWDARTAYQDEFPAHAVEPRAPVPAAPATRSAAKFDSTTTSASDYVRHALEPHAVVPVEHVRAMVPFVGETEAQAVFQPWPVHIRPPPPEVQPRQTVPFTGSSSSHADYQGTQPAPGRAAFGVAMLGDRMHTLIPANAPLPASAKQVFTSAHAGQREMSLLLCQGGDICASRNKLLGQFHLRGLPPAPAGTPQVEVTFNVSAAGEFSAAAQDMESGRCYTWQP